jgi:spore germination cell wall hydrolase CwlJ-like protein
MSRLSAWLNADLRKLVLLGGLAVCALAGVWILKASARPLAPSHQLFHPAKSLVASALSAPAPAAAPSDPADEQLTPEQAAAINDAVPLSKLPNPAARPFRLAAGASPEDRARALTCLTMAVYYEAYGQGANGEAAVAQVVLNRVRHPLFPKSVCGVVFQGAQLSTGCQFTFTCDGSLARRPDEAGWTAAGKIAQQALEGRVMKAVGEATHYHTIWVVPYWQASVVKLTRIGAHIFYRWPGGMGVPAAFHGVYAGGEPAPPKIKGMEDAAPVELASLTSPALISPTPPAPVTPLTPAPAMIVKAATVPALAKASPAPTTTKATTPVSAEPVAPAIRLAEVANAAARPSTPEPPSAPPRVVPATQRPLRAAVVAGAVVLTD